MALRLKYLALLPLLVAATACQQPNNIKTPVETYATQTNLRWLITHGLKYHVVH